MEKQLLAAKHEVFCLVITQLQKVEMDMVFKHLANLTYLTLTYGAKHVNMDYERPLFGMKMSEAKMLQG